VRGGVEQVVGDAPLAFEVLVGPALRGIAPVEREQGVDTAATVQVRGRQHPRDAVGLEGAAIELRGKQRLVRHHGGEINRAVELLQDHRQHRVDRPCRFQHARKIRRQPTGHGDGVERPVRDEARPPERVVVRHQRRPLGQRPGAVMLGGDRKRPAIQPGDITVDRIDGIADRETPHARAGPFYYREPQWLRAYSAGWSSANPPGRPATSLRGSKAGSDRRWSVTPLAGTLEQEPFSRNLCGVGTWRLLASRHFFAGGARFIDDSRRRA
jgi:hypothetical protein